MNLSTQADTAEPVTPLDGTSALLGKPHRKNHPRHLGIAPLGGGLNPCPDGLGQLFLEEFPSFWGGLDPCPDGLGHFFPR